MISFFEERLIMYFFIVTNLAKKGEKNTRPEWGPNPCLPIICRMPPTCNRKEQEHANYLCGILPLVNVP